MTWTTCTCCHWTVGVGVGAWRRDARRRSARGIRLCAWKRRSWSWAAGTRKRQRGTRVLCDYTNSHIMGVLRMVETQCRGFLGRTWKVCVLESHVTCALFCWKDGSLLYKYIGCLKTSLVYYEYGVHFRMEMVSFPVVRWFAAGIGLSSSTTCTSWTSRRSPACGRAWSTR